MESAPGQVVTEVEDLLARLMEDAREEKEETSSQAPDSMWAGSKMPKSEYDV